MIAKLNHRPRLSCELIRDLPHVIPFLVVRLEVGAIHGSDFWLLLLGGWLPTLPPSYVVLLETPGKGQIVRLDLPEEQHKNNKLFSEYNS